MRSRKILRAHRAHKAQIVPTLTLLVACTQATYAADAAENPQPVQPVVNTDADEIVISATRLSENIVEQPYAIYRLDNKEMEFRNTRALVDSLHATPGIAIQRTAANQASPFIRGLTGEQTLLLFNGIRLNHSMMRPGPNQYAALMPDNSIGNIDIILGSASTVLGSDGLTGAIDFRLSEAGRGRTEGIGGYSDLRYGTADNGGGIAAGLDGRQGAWAWTAEISYEKFEDFRAGTDSGENLFGTAAGQREVPNTSYDQQSVNTRVIYDGLENQKFELSAGTVQQNDAPRPDGYFANSNETSRISRSYPQQNFSYVHARHYWTPESEAIAEVKTTLWYNQFDEEQIRERLRDSGTTYLRQQYQDTVATIGLEVQVQHNVGENHDLTTGMTVFRDSTQNNYQAFASLDTDPANATQSILTKDQENAGASVPDGSAYDGLGLYVQDNWHLNEQWSLLSGVRYSRYAWNADVTGRSYPVDIVDGSTDALTASVRAAWNKDENWHYFAGISQGFRAPNLKNLMGSNGPGSSNTFFVGNPDLDPEQSISYEIGARYEFVDAQNSYIALNVFYTTIDDVIQRVYIDDGEGGFNPVFANGEDATLNGFEFHFNLALPYFENNNIGALSVYSVNNFVNAEEKVAQSDGTFITDNMSRANRLFGFVGLKYSPDTQNARWWIAGHMRWSAEFSDPAATDADDPRLTVPGRADGSMAGYAVFDIKAGWTNVENTQTYNVSLENIADTTYRDVGSGADGVGLNLVVNAKLTF